MRTRSMHAFIALAGSLVLVAAACGGQAPAGGGGGAPAAKPFIPMISKGFQHQFWQAVKQGAEKAAVQYNVNITFEGPENESQVDKQMEMLQAAINKKPQALCFAALDSKAAIPLLQKPTDLAKAILQANPNLKGMFGANEGSAIGVLNGVKESGKTGKVVVIGYDSGQQQLDAIRSGAESGAITQDPIGIGFKCVEAAYKAIKGEKLDKNIDTGI